MVHTVEEIMASVRLRRRCPSLRTTRSFFSWGKAADAPVPPPTTTPIHIPVLLHETVTLWLNPLDPSPRKRRTPRPADESTERWDPTTPRFYVDGTTGFGGHSRELLRREPHAQLLCIDRDPEVLAIARANLADFSTRVVFHRGSYADLSPDLLRSVHFPDEVHGICVDLGANSFHFDEGRRGFSYMRDGPLDMRYNQQDDSIMTAAHVLNTFSEVQLTKIFRDLGEERLAKEYAKAIVRDRDERSVVFTQTSDLRECIERIARKWNTSGADRRRAKKSNGGVSIHPATKCFQALRIYVNDELTHVATGVEQLVAQLAPTGRLATIAFHSLEDRPIKRLFRRLDMFTRRTMDDEYEDYFDDYDDEDEDEESDDVSGHDVLKRLGPRRYQLVKRKAVKAKKQEIEMNPRSRSARLRCLERII